MASSIHPRTDDGKHFYVPASVERCWSCLAHDVDLDSRAFRDAGIAVPSDNTEIELAAFNPHHYPATRRHDLPWMKEQDFTLELTRRKPFAVNVEAESTYRAFKLVGNRQSSGDMGVKQAGSE